MTAHIGDLEWGGPGGQEPVIPARLLASPTIGAVRRARGQAGPSGYYRHLLAVSLVDELVRQAIAARLEGIIDACLAGAQPRHIAARIDQLATRLAPLAVPA